jgi:hypothetical protein
LIPLLVLAAACGDAGAAKKKKPAPEPVEGVAVGQRPPAFEVSGVVYGEGGQASELKVDSRKRARPTAYAFVGTHCPTTAKYMGRLAAIEQSYAGKVDFVFLYPNKTDALAEKQGFHKQHALRGPLVDDLGAGLAKLMGAQRTAEIVLTDKAGVSVYRGAIDDSKDEAQVKRRHLGVAIDEHLAGKAVSTPKTDVFA